MPVNSTLSLGSSPVIEFIATSTSVLILPARPLSVTDRLGHLVFDPFVLTLTAEALDQPEPPLVIVIVEMVFQAELVE